jgi:hypothetical protein
MYVPQMFDFELRLAHTGCIEARLSSPEQEVFVSATPLSDAPADLTRAILLLLEGSPEARCSWQEEPGEYRWLFTRQGGVVRLTVLDFPDAFSRQDDLRGECLFMGECELQWFASRLQQQFHYFLATLGAEDYQREWRYPFPAAELHRLQELLSRPNHDSEMAK